MSDKADKKQQPIKPADATSKTSNKGPHGGGNKYFQMKKGDEFMVHDPIGGHKQKTNVKPDKK